MAEAIMLATVAVAAVDGALSAGLLIIYARSYSKVKAPFTVGLMMFAALFLVQNALAVYSYLAMMSFFPDAVAPYMLVIMVLEGLALGVMLYYANK